MPAENGSLNLPGAAAGLFRVGPAPAGGDGKRFGDHTGILAVWAFACGTAHHQDYRAGAGALCGMAQLYLF